MNDRQFDRFSRRLVLAGLSSNSIATFFNSDESEAKKKRCRKKKRVRCGNRCCPRGKRCENRTCFRRCEDPFSCSGGGGGSDACAENFINCICTTTIAGAAACINFPIGDFCSDYVACGAAASCPTGQIRGHCSCGMGVPNRRCFPPCLGV